MLLLEQSQEGFARSVHTLLQCSMINLTSKKCSNPEQNIRLSACFNTTPPRLIGGIEAS